MLLFIPCVSSLGNFIGPGRSHDIPQSYSTSAFMGYLAQRVLIAKAHNNELKVKGFFN